MEDSGIDSEDVAVIKQPRINDLSDVKDCCTTSAFDDLDDISFRASKSSDFQTEKIPTNAQLSTCKILHRKLELKVERAKKSLQERSKPTISNLIPINRLKFPGRNESQPLVDYHSDSDEPDDISFFTAKAKTVKKLDLTDTFSIREMTIESDNHSDDSGSQNLEFQLPTQRNNWIDKLLNFFYCNSS